MRSLRSILCSSNKRANPSASITAGRSGAMIEGLESRQLFSVALLHPAVIPVAIKAAPAAVSVKPASAAADNDGDIICGTVSHFPIPIPIHINVGAVAVAQIAAR